MLVPEDTRASARGGQRVPTARIKVGPADPTDAAMGPVISAAQREKCETFVAAAEEHGGKVVCGGGRPPGLDRGYYFEPTVLDLPDNANPAAREEIFGPVIACSATATSTMPSRSPTTASTDCRGRCTAPMSPPRSAVASRLRTGAVNVNADRLQRVRAERWLQAERPRPRTGSRRDPRISGSQTHVDRGAGQMTSTITKPSVESDESTPIDLNWLISVDDHILEPPQPVGRPRRVQGPGPRPAHGGRRQGHGRLGLRRQEDAQFGSERRRRQVQGGVQPRATELLGDAARVLRRQGASRGHGPLRCACVAVLSDAAPVLWAVVHGGQRPGVRLRVPSDLQRLARRGVVRCRPWPLHPADADPHVGSAAGGQGDGAHGRQGRHVLRLLREPGTVGAAHDSRCRPLLGARHGRGQRARNGGQHARRLVVDAAQDLQ